MDIEMLLRTTLVMMDKMHIMGAETELHAAIKKNIKTAVDEICRMKAEREKGKLMGKTEAKKDAENRDRQGDV